MVREQASQSPFTAIFIDLWPFIVDILQTMGHLDRVSESSTRLVKHSIRIIPEEFKQYMIQFLQIVIQQFEVNPCSAFIYSIEFCMGEYYQNQDFDDIFKEAFEVIINKCSRILNEIQQSLDVKDRYILYTLQVDPQDICKSKKYSFSCSKIFC